MDHSQNKVFNILHVVSRLPVGGVENMLFKILKAYDKTKFNPFVCCIKEGGEVADELKKAGYKVEILNRMKVHGFDLAAVRGIYNVIKRENIHILRTHQYHANLYGRIAGIVAGVPLMVPSFHNIYESPAKPKFHRRTCNYFLSFFSDALVAVSETVASDLIKYDSVNPGKIKVVHNGIEIEKFNSVSSKQAAKKTFNLPYDRIIIGSVGRFTDQKGQHYLIEAVSEINDACVAIAGSGPLMQELKNYAAQRNVNCILPGRLNPDSIPLFLRAIDIYCFPSLWEGFPSALVEAMAAGLPVVASDIPPHEEVLGDAGILVPPGDSGKLAETLSMLIENPSLRELLGEKAKRRAENFSIRNTVTSYENLFEELLKKKGLLQ